MSDSKSPLAEAVEPLREVLVGRGYGPATIAQYDRLLGQLGDWSRVKRIDRARLTEEQVRRFARSRADGKGTVLRLATLLVLLRELGVVPPPARSASEVVLDGFGEYLIRERRLASLTVTTRFDVIRRFLVWRSKTGDLNLAGLTVVDVHGFVLHEAARLHRGSVGPVLDSMRSFLRYLFFAGIIDRDLAVTLPPVALRRHPALPRAVDAATVATLFANCDRSTAAGLRDVAILTLLVRLGLRANEVASMTLDDIDWRAGELLVHGKGRRDERMPLPPDVGQALATYLRRGRPVCSHRAVFCRVVAPAGALSRNGVVMVPRTASRRAGIPEVGAHRLRHTAATSMLDGGASWREVGQVLRHHRSQTTAIYASSGADGLRQLARSWPRAGR
jgi:integrase/recombinase XerD